MTGNCPNVICKNRNENGYCKTTACVNPHGLLNLDLPADCLESAAAQTEISKTNADLLRQLPTPELADKIYNELAMFPSKSSLLQYLEQTAEP